MMKRRVRFVLLSFVAALSATLFGAAPAAQATTIMQETLSGDGVSRSIITRSVTAPAPGQYLLTLKNGSIGPRLIEQCETEDTIELKNECRFRNLNERIEQDFSRIQDAFIKVNNVRIRNPQALTQKTITKARGFLIIPVTLNGGTNKVDIDLLGYSTSRLTVTLESAPSAPLPPSAAFLVSRIQGTTATPFTLDAKESFSPNGNPLTYSWNWGDGTITSSGTRVAHSYTAAGLYTAVLTVTDQASNLTSSFSTALNVKAVNGNQPPENEKPTPGIQWAIDSGNPLHVLLDGSTSTDDGTIASYSWRITNQSGAVQTRSGIQLDYIFPEAGSYTIRLTVKDNLGAQAAIERVISLADLSGLVRDESLLGPKKYYGSTASESKTIESLTLASPRLAVLKIKNADGLEHPIESCSSTPWPEKIACLFQNTVNRAYLALYRVNSANVYINGRRVTDGTSIGKQKAYFESVVSLQSSNTIDIRVKGWPTAFIELELQSLEVNEAPIVYVTHSEARRGIPQLIEFDASTSVDMNDHIMSYRFQVLNAAGAVAIDTDWQAASYAALEFTESGVFTVTVSARDTFGAVGTKSLPITIESNQLPLVTASYVVLSNQAPYQVRVTATASDPDGDAIQYNFAYSTGQVSGFQDSPQGLTSFAAVGTYSVAVTARDINGGIATFTLPITVGGNLLPIANFDFVTDRGGYAPLTITVDASPSSDPDDATETLRYFWTFGDNSPRVEGKILSHTFISQGQYTVTLSVLDPKRGLSTKSRAAFAWRTTPPNPVLIANPRLGPASLTVDFDASNSTPGASPIASYLFDYNDGTFESSLTPFKTHTFTQPGIYNVGLIVYDTDGNGNIGGQTIYVFDGKKPSAAIQVVASDVITPARFELQGSGVSPNPLGTITDYKWTLPNGTVQTGASLIYTTSTNGNFAIKLEVKDSYGYWSDPAILDLSAATGTLPIAQITADKTRIALGQAVKLSGLNSYTSNGQANLVSYEWTLPNGTKIYGPEKTVTLSATGLKTISLVVTDSKGYVSSPATIQIQVDARQTPTAVITASTSGTIIPVTATANGLQSTTPNPGATITGYEWRLQAPDATPPLDIQAFGPEIQGVLTWPVNYTLSLRVFDSAGAVSGWVSHTFGPLLNTPPIAVITPSSVIDTAPTTVTLSSIGSTDPDGHNIVNAHWIFSDGGEYWGLIAPYYIASPGSYTATVRVLDEYGAWSDPVTVPITLNANLPPVALMTAAPDANNKFNFTFDASTSFDLDGIVTRYDWFFSDGFVSLGAGPVITHAFPSAGTWRAGVNVFDNKGAMATVQVEVTVSANLPPVARIKVLSTDFDTHSISLSATDSTDDTGIANYSWSFDDGTTASGATATKSFAEGDSHKVTLSVTDVDGQKTTASQFVVIDYQGAPVANVVASIGSGFGSYAVGNDGTLNINTIPADVSFSSDSALISASVDKEFLWNFGDGQTSTNQNPKHRYSKPGLYDVTLTIKDPSGSTSSAALKILIPEELCLTDEFATCFSIVGQDPGLIDPTQQLILEPSTSMNFAPDSLNLRLSQSTGDYGNDMTSIDISAHGRVQGGQVIIDIPSLLPTLVSPLDTYDLSLSVVGLPDFTPIHGTVKGFAIAGGSISIQTTNTISKATVTNDLTGYQASQSPNSTNVLFPKLPRGNYSIYLEGTGGFAYGNATLETAATVQLSGSLYASDILAFTNQLANNQPMAAASFQKMNSAAPAMMSATDAIDPYNGYDNIYPVALVDSIQQWTPNIGRTAGVMTGTIGPNIAPGPAHILSIVDQSKFSDVPGHVLAPGESVTLKCHAFSNEYFSTGDPEYFAMMPGAHQYSRSLYVKYTELKATADAYFSAYLSLNAQRNLKSDYCQTLMPNTPEYISCYTELYAIWDATREASAKWVTADQIAKDAETAYRDSWTEQHRTAYSAWVRNQPSKNIRYELIAHLKYTKSVQTKSRSISVGTFSAMELKGNWDSVAGPWGTKDKKLVFTMPPDVPVNTNIIYELRFKAPGVFRAAEAEITSGRIFETVPQHRAFCAPTPDEPILEILSVGIAPPEINPAPVNVPVVSKLSKLANSLKSMTSSSQSLSAETPGACSPFDQNSRCNRLTRALQRNGLNFTTIDTRYNYALFSIDKDLTLTSKSQTDIFATQNPYSLETQSSAHTQFLDESYDMLIDVTLRRRNVPIVTLDVSISNEAVSPADTVILRSVTSTVPSDYIIRNIWIEHSTVASAIRAKGWDVPSASGVTPKLRFRVSAGAAAPLLAQDEVDQSVYIQRNMKLISSTPNFLYGENIVSFGRTELFKFITDLNAFAIKPGSAFLDDSTTTTPNDGYGLLRINDGSAPYGGTYGPHQGSHGNGLSLDIKPFGNSQLGENYDVIRGSDSRSPRYDDILAVLEYSKLQNNPLDTTEFMWTERECAKAASEPNSKIDCSAVLTVEKCLYQIEPTNPPNGVSLGKCDQSVRPINAALRLEKWVRHNRNGIRKLISSSKSRSLHLSTGIGWNDSLREALDSETAYKDFFSELGVQRNLLIDAMLPNGFKLYQPKNDGTFVKLSDSETLDGLKFGNDDGHYNHIHINSILPTE